MYPYLSKVVSKPFKMVSTLHLKVHCSHQGEAQIWKDHWESWKGRAGMSQLFFLICFQNTGNHSFLLRQNAARQIRLRLLKDQIRRISSARKFWENDSSASSTLLAFSIPVGFRSFVLNSKNLQPMNLSPSLSMRWNRPEVKLGGTPGEPFGLRKVR